MIPHTQMENITVNHVLLDVELLVAKDNLMNVTIVQVKESTLLIVNVHSISLKMVKKIVNNVLTNVKLVKEMMENVQFVLMEELILQSVNVKWDTMKMILLHNVKDVKTIALLVKIKLIVLHVME